MTQPIRPARILGLDVARAIAIAGMALIHFATVLSGGDFGSALGWLIDRLSGRPAAAFMILAGIGVSLQLARSVDRTKRRLWRRGWFFLAFGYLNLVLWPGDILRVYGIAYLVATLFVVANSRQLWTAAASIVVVFVSLIFVIDFETNWDFSTLDYANLWTPAGAVMNLFYNGFRAVFPWLALFFVGMVVGKCDLRSEVTQKRLMLLGLSAWVLAEVFSFFPRTAATIALPNEAETIYALLGTDSLPPMPFFLLSSSGLAILGIAASIYLVERRKVVPWIGPVASAGQMAFTWYMAHIVVVIASGIVTDFRGDVSMTSTFGVATMFFVAMVAISWLYRRYFRMGPLELLLRTVTK